MGTQTGTAVIPSGHKAAPLSQKCDMLGEGETSQLHTLTAQLSNMPAIQFHQRQSLLQRGCSGKPSCPRLKCNHQVSVGLAGKISWQ